MNNEIYRMVWSFSASSSARLTVGTKERMMGGGVTSSGSEGEEQATREALLALAERNAITVVPELVRLTLVLTSLFRGRIKGGSRS